VLDGEHLLAASGRSLENADVAALDDVKTGAGVAFAEDQVAGVVVPGHCAVREELQFGVGEVGEDRHASQYGGAPAPSLRHLRILRGRTRPDKEKPRPTPPLRNPGQLWRRDREGPGEAVHQRNESQADSSNDQRGEAEQLHVTQFKVFPDYRA